MTINGNLALQFPYIAQYTQTAGFARQLERDAANQVWRDVRAQPCRFDLFVTKEEHLRILFTRYAERTRQNQIPYARNPPPNCPFPSITPCDSVVGLQHPLLDDCAYWGYSSYSMGTSKLDGSEVYFHQDSKGTRYTSADHMKVHHLDEHADDWYLYFKKLTSREKHEGDSMRDADYESQLLARHRVVYHGDYRYSCGGISMHYAKVYEFLTRCARALPQADKRRATWENAHMVLEDHAARDHARRIHKSRHLELPHRKRRWTKQDKKAAKRRLVAAPAPIKRIRDSDFAVPPPPAKKPKLAMGK